MPGGKEPGMNIDQLILYRDFEHEALLHQAGFAGEQGVAGHFVMMGMRGGDIYEVDVGVRIYFTIRTVCFFHIPLLGECSGFFL